MEYTERFNALKSIFTHGESEIRIPDSLIKIRNTGFCSDLPMNGFMDENDLLIPENRSFSYPVFVPRNAGSKKVILLLHGLNERSWLKYLPWACSLSDNTDSYIILFPISFHINRSPESWRDPRLMVNLLNDRNSAQGLVDKSSFANLALSNRLTEDPMRFFKSGYQTVEDIRKLASDITEGRHPLIPKTSDINIFAYSIGAFMAEIIMMGNPGKLFSESKLFIFSGGSVFSNMRGASKLIMDSRAFDRVYNYFLNDFEGTINGKGPLVNFLRSSQLGMAFRSMIDTGRFRSFRENLLKKLQDQIHTIVLARDAIIPPGGTIATLGRFLDKDNLKVWDFQYEYTHENPFPLTGSPLSRKVDYWFERVFAEAALFLA